jgi:cytoplasmic iron level regulating protein YaaA (DUF328/UPF0246 family)
MNMEPAAGPDFPLPEFLDRSALLADRARRFSPAELMDFMDISAKLAALNHQRFQEWTPTFTPENAKPAVLAFTGDVYEGLEAPKLSPGDLAFAQTHLRILSGLYGLLRPLDLIQPYRLEMGRPLAVDGSKNLYQFWKKTITEQLNQSAGDTLVNLASNEYFKVIDKRTLDKQIISPVFKDEKNGRLKIISFYAKKARGSMARFIIKNRITTAEALLDFKESGYRYRPELSTPAEPVFTRPEQAK